jgi:hypothetical protein
MDQYVASSREERASMSELNVALGWFIAFVAASGGVGLLIWHVGSGAADKGGAAKPHH